MRTLDRAFSQPEFGGRRLHLPWRSVERFVSVYTQELVQVIGAPGGGKSTFAVNLAMDMGQPVLYLAQDTPNSVMTRMAAIAIGEPVREVQKMYQDADKRQKIGRMIRQRWPHVIIQRGTQTTDDIDSSLGALEEWLGAAPPLVIIDNLIDLQVPGQHFQDPGFYATALPILKRISQERDTCILMLHHVVKSEKESGQVALRLADVLHAGARESRHVWGVFHDADHMYLQFLKNQEGAADGEGNLRAGFKWIPEAARLLEVL